ncbi:MAG TPA: adenine deaminase [Anaerolineales bacterium]|nr:adenine deaminase [Anaerolineales bacterium]
MVSDIKSTRALIDVAMSRQPADLVIRKGTWVCVQSGELVPETDIAVKDGRIAYVGPDASHTIGKQTRLLEAGGRYLVPGLLDGHMHVESGMVTITEFVRAVLPHGTTGMFIDPHEIANVFGLKGVRLMADEAVRQPVHVWVQVPSCVPSAAGFETPGEQLSAQDVAEAMSWPGIIGLGEMMNYPGVAAGDEKMLAEMDATRRAGKVIGGHYPSLDLGPAFHAYAAGGPEDDHEGTRPEDAVERVRQGMKSMLRYGSAWQDVARGVKAITEYHLDPRHFILCTDDSHAATLVKEGHMDRVLRHAIQQGLAPLAAIQMATLNTAEHFGVSREVGMIAPGRWADILLVDDLNDFHAGQVILRGVVAAGQGTLSLELPGVTYPDWATHSIHLKRVLTAGDFCIPAPISRQQKVRVNVIGIIENQAPNRHMHLEALANDGNVQADMTQDLAKAAVVERHHARGTVQMGLVSGFGLKVPCAIASTVAHDCHQMIVVGTDENDMALAANKLAEVGGGQVVVKNGQVIGLVELSIGGLMSTEPATVVADKAMTILDGFRACGCVLNNPNMQLSLLALVVIPELRLTDKGLVDGTNFTFLPVVEGPA